MRNFEDILKNEQDHLSDEELLKYLQGQLNSAGQHDVEKHMTDDAFLNDAMEGLAGFQSQSQIQDQVKQLNQQLQTQLGKRKRRKGKRGIKDMSWILTAAIIVLLLAILGYAVLHIYHHGFTLHGPKPVNR